MKKHKLVYILLALLAIGFNACKKQQADEQIFQFAGKWVGEYSGGSAKVYQEVYVFNTDSTYIFTRQLADSVTKQLISYQYQSTGKYHYKDTKLQLYAIKAKYSYNYGPLDQLTDIQQVTVPIDYSLSFNAYGTGFEFIYPPCPINALCAQVASLKYYRK